MTIDDELLVAVDDAVATIETTARIHPRRLAQRCCGSRFNKVNVSTLPGTQSQLRRVI